MQPDDRIYMKTQIQQNLSTSVAFVQSDQES